MAKTKTASDQAATAGPVPRHVRDDIVDHLMVKPGTKADLKNRDPGWKAGRKTGPRCQSRIIRPAAYSPNQSK